MVPAYHVQAGRATVAGIELGGESKP